jgi:hexulose-6-phosphate isomerase
MLKLGIMQGRLVPPEAGRFQSFPRLRWRDEFALAAAVGLDTIEWIYDAYGEDENPLGTDSGSRELGRLSVAHGIAVESVCADWFMDFPLVGVDSQTARPRWERLAWLMRRCAPLGIHRIVLPFVDASAIRSTAAAADVAAGINALAGLIDTTGVELHLETALAPAEFAALLVLCSHPRIRVNYDAGNSASLGYRPAEEFAAYGERVGSVHLKDRVLGAGTVPLGTGDTDFTALFAALSAAQYRGDFILQVARGAPGGELEWARVNAGTARRMMQSLQPQSAAMSPGQ